MGFIHYNCTIAEQAAAVAKVKAHCPGFVVTPVCMKPTDPVSALDELKVRWAHRAGRAGVEQERRGGRQRQRQEGQAITAVAAGAAAADQHAPAGCCVPPAVWCG